MALFPLSGRRGPRRRPLAEGLALLGGFVCLAAAAPAPAQVTALVDQDTPMAYRVNSSDPGIGRDWTAPGFSEVGWRTQSYVVNLGQGPEATLVLWPGAAPGTRSVYARATFDVADTKRIQGLRLGMSRAGAYAVWINGVEVYRSSRLSTGELDWSTSADRDARPGDGVADAEERDISVVGVPALRDGQNLLAVGVWGTSLGEAELVPLPELRAAASGDLLRGPYLQSGSPTSVTVCWRTASAEDSRVVYGTEPGVLDTAVTDATAVTDHKLTLNGLSPDTTYYYAFGDTSRILGGNDPDHFFLTAPVPGTEKSTRVWVLGDSGTGNEYAEQVRDAYYGYTGARHTDLWLMLGDNAYEDGTDAEYQWKLFRIYPDMLQKSVLWPTMGNHDLHSATSSIGTGVGVYYDIFALPMGGEAGGVASGTEAYYSFDYANIHFVVLESAELFDLPEMYDWLTLDLADTTQEWIVVYFHHPPYTGGGADQTTPESTGLRTLGVPIMEDAGVDLVLAGHNHNYERSWLLDMGVIVNSGDGREDGDGVYYKPGVTPGHEGAVYVVAGSSGKIGGGPAPEHPLMYVSYMLHGSMVLDVEGARLDAIFLDRFGDVLDYFTLVHSAECNDGVDNDGDGWADFPADPGCAMALDTHETGCANPAITDPDGDGACSLAPVVTEGSTMSYLANGEDPLIGTGWTAEVFDDSSWPTGKYGVGYDIFGAPPTALELINEPVPNYTKSVYTRTDFDLIDASAAVRVLIDGDYDDGYAAWLNGVEIFRSAELPAELLWDTQAIPHESSNGSEPLFGNALDVSAAALPALKDGTNRLAVGIWNSGPTSSDLLLVPQLLIDTGLDNCPDDPNPEQADLDADGSGDACDSCTDADGDGYGDPGFPANTCDEDNCPGVANPDQSDGDGDGVGDACDACFDTDGDGYGDPGVPGNPCPDDNCPGVANPGQEDGDADGLGDVCDPCPSDPGDDADGDGVCFAVDNCPATFNPDQADADADGAGDACDDCTDPDGDDRGTPGLAGTCPEDNCPWVYNPAQTDSDADGVGNSCDCANEDPTTFAIPGNVENLHFLDKEDFQWDSLTISAGTSTRYDVLRGRLGQFPVGTGNDENCLKGNLFGTVFTDHKEPKPDEPQYYLIRGTNPCGDGTYGQGNLRTSSACD